ncbi:exported serine protease, subtilase family [gut metagenome]|uniref:Exported serine protease, subtilase family n=1 Tax=gut metagenome TaxID=749906 RepID=J9GAF6_9ZZZZ
MKTTLFTLLCAGCFSLTAFANQSKAATQTDRPAKIWRYRVALADKKNCGYTVKHPEAFLSTASIQRRRRLGLKVDQHDLPLTPSYLQQLREVGMKICYQSKWNNTVVVETADTTQMRKVRRFPS